MTNYKKRFSPIGNYLPTITANDKNYDPDTIRVYGDERCLLALTAEAEKGYAAMPDTYKVIEVEFIAFEIDDEGIADYDNHDTVVRYLIDDPTEPVRAYQPHDLLTAKELNERMVSYANVEVI